MSLKTKVSSRRVGLDIGLAIGRYFLNTEDLHYGYWPIGKTATVQNFSEAQEMYSQLIIDHIPEKTWMWPAGNPNPQYARRWSI